jgi:DNA-binding NarL/FixJ family response regulator
MDLARAHTGGREMSWRVAAEHPARVTPGIRDGGARNEAGLRRATAEARTALEDAVVAAAVAAERARSIAEALDRALAVLSASDAPTPNTARAHDAADGVGTLSPREREVLALVAEGRSNMAIAEALYVSPNTVKTHVASLLHTLDAQTRVQLAAIAPLQL